MATGTHQAEIPADALRLTWEDVLKRSIQLAEMIEGDCQKSGQQYDLMLIVPRGSYYPANIISRKLGFASTDMLHACIGSYESGKSERSGEFTLGQMPAPEQVKDRDILIIEEVCDTGHTLKFLVDWLKFTGAKKIKTAALHYKPARSETGFKPDWYAEETDKWIVYPWETYEEQGKSSKVRR
jgi:uncharacterized protein